MIPWGWRSESRGIDAWRGSEGRALFLALPEVKGLLSAEHFSVDGTLLKAWASMKSFRPKDGSGEPPQPGRNGEADFRKTKRRTRRMPRRRTRTHGSGLPPWW